jgi:hypothetical protein
MMRDATGTEYNQAGWKNKKKREKSVYFSQMSISSNLKLDLMGKFTMD